jgi:hypothetical protein
MRHCDAQLFKTVKRNGLTFTLKTKLVSREVRPSWPLHYCTGLLQRCVHQISLAAGAYLLSGPRFMLELSATYSVNAEHSEHFGSHPSSPLPHDADVQIRRPLRCSVPLRPLSLRTQHSTELQFCTAWHELWLRRHNQIRFRNDDPKMDFLSQWPIIRFRKLKA